MKIDLADAYNQIALGPESQKRLALSHTKAFCSKCVYLLVLCLPRDIFRKL